jgi:hypothetical protein
VNDDSADADDWTLRISSGRQRRLRRYGQFVAVNREIVRHFALGVDVAALHDEIAVAAALANGAAADLTLGPHSMDRSALDPADHAHTAPDAAVEARIPLC